MRTRLSNLARDRGPDAIIVLLFTSAALLYAPYAGDVGAVSRPKGAVAVFAAFALGALALLRNRDQEAAGSRDRPLGAAITVWTMAWILSAIAVFPGWEWTWNLLRYALVLGLAIAAGARLPRVLGALLWALPWAGLAIAATVLLQVHGINPPGLPDDWIMLPGVRLPAGTFVHRNAPAYFMALCLPPTLFMLMRTRNRRYWLLWIAGAALLVAAIVGTRCRGAWIGALLALVLLGVCRRSWTIAPRFSRAFRVAGAAVGTAVLAVLVATLPFGALPVQTPAGLAPRAVERRARVNKLVDERSLVGRLDVFNNHSTWSGRLRYWRHALGLAAAAPVLGHGPGGFRASAREHLATRYYTERRAHNTFLESAADAGVAAALALAGLCLLALYRCWRKRNALPEASILAAMLLVVGIQFSVATLTSTFAVYFGLVVGAALGLRASTESPKGARETVAVSTPSPRGAPA